MFWPDLDQGKFHRWSNAWDPDVITANVLTARGPAPLQEAFGEQCRYPSFHRDLRAARQRLTGQRDQVHLKLSRH